MRREQLRGHQPFSRPSKHARSACSYEIPPKCYLNAQKQTTAGTTRCWWGWCPPSTLPAAPLEAFKHVVIQSSPEPATFWPSAKAGKDSKSSRRQERQARTPNNATNMLLTCTVLTLQGLQHLVTLLYASPPTHPHPHMFGRNRALVPAMLLRQTIHSVKSNGVKHCWCLAQATSAETWV
jgi:hypothetical protein